MHAKKPLIFHLDDFQYSLDNPFSFMFFVYYGYVKRFEIQKFNSRADLEVIHRILNISETVQIGTPKPNVLLFLMMRDVK